MSATRRRLFGLLAVAPVAAALPSPVFPPPAYGRLIKVGAISPEKVRELRAVWDAARGTIVSDCQPSLDSQRRFTESTKQAELLTARLGRQQDDSLAGLHDGPDNGGLL